MFFGSMCRTLRSTAVLVLLAGISGALVAPGSARAYEGRSTLSVLGGLALRSDTSPANAGPTIGASASLGLSDVFTLRGHTAYSFYPNGTSKHFAVVGGELLYLVDIATWVPFAGGGLDASMFGSEENVDFHGGIHVVVGLDRWIQRNLLVGFDVRAFYFVPGISTFTANLRVSWACERW